MKINLMEPVCTPKMIRASVDALKAGRFLRGKSVEEFETEFAKYIGVKRAVSVNNGTMALVLSLMAMGVGPGDAVITTPASFIATGNAILFTGAKPIFADIDPKTNNLDPKKVSELLNEKKNVKAIVPVHLYGYPAAMDELLGIAKSHGVKLLEDACQGHGGSYKGMMLGSLGDAAAFSFYPSKNMTVCGDGGMVTTNEDQIADAVESLRDNGRVKGSEYYHKLIGMTARMQSSNAAIGKVQLSYLDKWVRKRRRIAKIYNKELTGVGDITIPAKETAEIKPAYHVYSIRTKHRDALREYLKNDDIESGIHYPIPIHRQPPYEQLGFGEGSLPHAELQAKEELSLPMHPFLKNEDVAFVVQTIKKFFAEKVSR